MKTSMTHRQMAPAAAQQMVLSHGAARHPAPRYVLTRAVGTGERIAPNSSAKQSMNQLDALKLVSEVVADTGEFNLIKEFHPLDSTTNPSLVLKAVKDPKYAHFLQAALTEDKGSKDPPLRPYASVADILAVNLGAEILKIVPGRVSTEVDAHLSYDTRAMVDKALQLVDLYESKGINSKERVYIKLASTWEGIRAAEELEAQGIRCNLTLLFSFAQAAACADAGAALISPFVGRIMDWYKAKEGREFASHEDPGVISVTKIYKHFKDYGYPTTVMAASFRNTGEITELAGCDKLTISPALLSSLAAAEGPLERKLFPGMGGKSEEKIDLTGGQLKLFNQLHGADQMAVEKLKEGIDGFSVDQMKLEAIIGDLKANL